MAEEEQQSEVEVLNSTIVPQESDESVVEADEKSPAEAVIFFEELMTKITEKSFKAMNAKNKMDNVAIFIDYDNVYWTLMNNYAHDPDHADPEKNLFFKLWKKYGQDNIRTFRAYADFERVRTELTSLQKKRVQIRHVYSNGKDGDHRKNSSDIELCIDAIEHTYRDPNISCYVFVTADSDMIPVISRMMYKNKRVELYYLSAAAPKHVDITSFVHSSEDLLSFLNIEVKQYKIDDFLIRALIFIREWHAKFGDQDKYLGASWLRNTLARDLGITVAVSSELLEKLKIEELTREDRKQLTNGEVKPTLVLTEKGEDLIKDVIDTAAATK